MTFKQFICSVMFLSAVSGSRATAQNEQIVPVASYGFGVPSVFSGGEPVFTDYEGDLTGPTKYVFHFLQGGKAFMDWASQRSGKSGRTFGVYSVVRERNGVKVEAQFIPGLDSLAPEIPATDYFESVTFRFGGGKAKATFTDDPNAPTFVISKVALKKTKVNSPRSAPRNRTYNLMIKSHLPSNPRAVELVLIRA